MVITDNEIRDASLEVLAALGVHEVEMEVSLMELDYLVELAQGGEVRPIDTSDPAGGFGAPDLWVATVVPAVAAVLAKLKPGAVSAEDVEQAIADIVARVGSPLAQRELPKLVETLRSVVLECGLERPR